MNHLTITQQIGKIKKLEDVVTTAANILIDRYGTELIIKKYDLLSEKTWQAVFQQMQQQTQESKQPLIYIEINKDIMNLEIKSQEQFYKYVVATLLAGIDHTNFKNHDKVQNLKELYEQDLKKIYNEQDYIYDRSILSPLVNIGVNLKSLLDYIDENKYNRPTPILNYSTVSNYPKQAVTVLQNTEKNAIEKPDPEIELAATYTSTRLFELLAGGGYSSLPKIVALPGWTIDILTGSWENQHWNRHTFWAQGAILEQLSYRTIIEI